MFVVLAVMMIDLHPAQPPGSRWVEVKRIRRPADMALVACFWLGFAAMLLLHAAARDVPLQPEENQTGHCCTLHSYGWVFHNGEFWHTLKISFLLALETIVVSLALFVPDGLLGAPEAAAAAAGDRVHGADPVRRAADRAWSSAC